MTVQQGRSEQRGESYSLPYVEPLSDTRTTLTGFFSIRLKSELCAQIPHELAQA